ncbi:MAG TPA: extracellular solute-binding protein [Dehalococcoidia bacterium]|nr:extracellular solute-binding protein [Dehalococcoidia bacterium]
MRRWLVSVLVLAGLLALAACAAEKEATPAPTAPATAGAKPAWEQEWDQVLAAAKREGKVAVQSDIGPALRQALTGPFEKKYGITVEHLGVAGREIPPRVKTERDAGQYLWDVYIHGTTTALESMIPMGAFDPIEPALILPEVKDPKNWRQGKLWFADKGHLALVMTPFQRGTLFVNPNMAPPAQFKSYKDLLDPKWKGKILMDDPKSAGPGQATFTFFYLHPELGADFIRQLAKQEITILKDYAQEPEWVAQGKYAIGLGFADFSVEALVRQGLPITIVDTRQLKEGSDVSPANGNVALYNRAPHPNAAKVYINWLLSKETQTEFAKATGYVSARVDVPTDHALPWRVPKEGAIETYTEAAMQVKERLVALLREVFGQ